VLITDYNSKLYFHRVQLNVANVYFLDALLFIISHKLLVYSNISVYSFINIDYHTSFDSTSKINNSNL